MSGPGSPLAWGSSHSGIGPTHPVALLRGAAGWWDVAQYSAASPQVLRNAGMGGAALDAQFGSTTGTDTNDPTVLPYTGSPYIALPGVAGNYLSVPDAAPLRITGDLEIVVRRQLADWTPATWQTLACRWVPAADQSFVLLVQATTGCIQLSLSSTGANQFDGLSTAAPPFTDGNAGWIKATWRASDGRVQFFTAADQPTEPGSWTQLGADRTAAAGSIFAGTSPFMSGAYGNGTINPATGCELRTILRNGINGTTVLDVDTSVLTSGSATSFTATTGQTVTINRSATGRKAVAVVRPVILFGTDDFLQVPDNDLLDFGTGSFSVLAMVRQWGTPTNNGRWLSKRDAGQGWSLATNGTAVQASFVMSDGTNTATALGPVVTAGVAAAHVVVVDRVAQTVTVTTNGTSGTPVSCATVGSVSNAIALRAGSGIGGSYQDFELCGFDAVPVALSASVAQQITAYYQQRMP